MSQPRSTFTARPDRGYAVSLEERDGYLRAHVSGPSDSIAISLAYWEELAGECHRLGHSKLLVVEDLGNSSSSMHDESVENYLVACELPRILLGIRVAFVDTMIEELASNRLGETVASSRGADVRLFLSEEAAVAWLTSLDR